LLRRPIPQKLNGNMFKSSDWINLQRDVDHRESAEYRQKREKLHEAEIELMQQRGRVAEMRRALPAGAVVNEDYAFQEGPTDLTAGDQPARKVRLPELCTAPNRSLVIYHFIVREAADERVPDVYDVDRRV
jgi:predicted dithiol-disulfide oxidoreductase (DUF899 family)